MGSLHSFLAIWTYSSCRDFLLFHLNWLNLRDRAVLSVSVRTASQISKASFGISKEIFRNSNRFPQMPFSRRILSFSFSANQLRPGLTLQTDLLTYY
jgi:hypothetical protein